MRQNNVTGIYKGEQQVEKWFVASKKADFNAIAEKFEIDPVIARLIRNRDVVGDDAIREYLNGSIRQLKEPKLLKDCIKSAEILKDKIGNQKKIRIIGDYDIDGVNATYILYQGLRRCGACVDYEIPDRMRDGYGLNEQLIRFAFDEGVDTVLTCDNGIAAIPQIAYAKELQMTVIITDHHEPLYEDEQGERRYLIPDADAVINPRQQNCDYPFKKLCGAAVAYKFICCLYEIMGIPAEEAQEFIEFAAIATVGDVMDLVEENRILVKHGLKMLADTKNYGLKALMEANGLIPANISAYHIGFVLGPCINASGRLDTAKRALELLLCEDQESARVLAEELKAMNDERKSMTLEGFLKAVDVIENSSMKQDKVLVVYLSDCHESLAGIIAGRVKERYHKPVFVLTDAKEGVKGSGRSIEAYNMFEEMLNCQDLFMKFGGHPMAAGLSLPKENVAEFKKRINDASKLTEEDFVSKVHIDIPMPIDYISEKLVGELEFLEPFGKGNTKPVFAEKDLNVLSARILGQNKNVVKMQIVNERGFAIDALYFGDVDTFRGYLEEQYGASETEKMFQNRENKVKLSVTYYPQINVFRDNRSLQIVVQNYC